MTATLLAGSVLAVPIPEAAPGGVTRARAADRHQRASAREACRPTDSPASPDEVDHRPRSRSADDNIDVDIELVCLAFPPAHVDHPRASPAKTGRPRCLIASRGLRISVNFTERSRVFGPCRARNANTAPLSSYHQTRVPHADPRPITAEPRVSVGSDPDETQDRSQPGPPIARFAVISSLDPAYMPCPTMQFANHHTFG